ncbi:exo-alpha-sialidase [Candidatus Chloroploca sp. M-50]|uniref:Exo-alpha-sialidase n=1 Tax=Candidatus Chloroploca mongolica TaxID=2528176 RepID=A0ABS4DHP3_9CHLR|nr:sialidase family protein [Candidatus Chloroploca mongolica]MBP1468960.1 exo-alpha-sialidase [Candidatus Chloroploca mongolica]
MSDRKKAVHSFLRMAGIFMWAMLIASINQKIEPHSHTIHAAGDPNISALQCAQLKIDQVATSSDLPNVIALNVSFQGSSLPPRLSTDGGSTWQVVPTMPASAISGIAIAPRQDPVAPVRILAYSGESLYRTGDGGQTWAERDFGLDGPLHAFITGMVASPADGNRLYIFATSWWYGPDWLDSWAYLSTDAGINWTRVYTVSLTTIGNPVLSPISPEDGFVRVHEWQDTHYWQSYTFPVDTLALDALASEHLYGLADFNPQEYPAIYYMSGKSSNDGGRSWTPWETMPSGGCGQLLAHPTQTQRLLARCRQGLYHSTDAGNHWEQVSPIAGNNLIPNYGSPGQLLQVRDDGLWQSNDDGLTWFQIFSTCLYKVFLPMIVH